MSGSEMTSGPFTGLFDHPVHMLPGWIRRHVAVAEYTSLSSVRAANRAGDIASVPLTKLLHKV